jgi:hypothetical protein
MFGRSEINWAGGNIAKRIGIQIIVAGPATTAEAAFSPGHRHRSHPHPHVNGTNVYQTILFSFTGLSRRLSHLGVAWGTLLKRSDRLRMWMGRLCANSPCPT